MLMALSFLRLKYLLTKELVKPWLDLLFVYDISGFWVQNRENLITNRYM